MDRGWLLVGAGQSKREESPAWQGLQNMVDPGAAFGLVDTGLSGSTWGQRPAMSAHYIKVS